MDEAEWLDCTHPRPMLEFLRGKVSERKLRLFACACCRRIEHFLTDEVDRKALDAAERYADGQLRDRSLQNWRRRAALARQPYRINGVWQLGLLAYYAVTQTLVSAKDDAYLEVHSTVARVVADATLRSQVNPAWHAAFQAESAVLSDLLRDIVGNPFVPSPAMDLGWLQWHNGTAAGLASAIYDERRFQDLPILADALEDAGCTNTGILTHCRQGGEHARGCWVVDTLFARK
jgi:hypothetical protein